jgi:hypothetical protein
MIIQNLKISKENHHFICPADHETLRVDSPYEASSTSVAAFANVLDSMYS